MKIQRKWWNGLLIFTDRGDPFIPVLQAVKNYPHCYFDSQNLCWHVSENAISQLEQEAFQRGFEIDIPAANNLTRTLKNQSGCTFDIETTGLRGDPQAHLVSACIGLSKVDPLEFWVDQPQQEKQILLQLAEVLQEMELIITWNGDRFDIPFLNDRFKTYDIPFQIQPMQSLDLYKIAEQMKADGIIPSAALQVVERFYGIVRPDQLPGQYVPERYVQYQENHDQQIRQEILQHNREDVLYLLMLSPFIYQGAIPQEDLQIADEERQLLDRYLLHVERIEKMLDEKAEMERLIHQIGVRHELKNFSRPYGDIQLKETACTIQKKEINSPPIRTFEELEEFYRTTLAQKPKRKWR